MKLSVRSNWLCVRLDLSMPAGSAGSAAAGGTTTVAAVGNCAPIAVGEEQGKHARGVAAFAFVALNRIVGLFDGTEYVKAVLAIQANVFVNRHRIPFSILYFNPPRQVGQ
jgi:hypothetical protein